MLTARRNQILGSLYNSLGYDTYASFSIIDKNHPVFLGIKKNVIGDSKLDCQNYKGDSGASGHETDKLVQGSGFSLLARGTNRSSLFMNTGADMVFTSLTEIAMLSCRRVTFTRTRASACIWMTSTCTRSTSGTHIFRTTDRAASLCAMATSATCRSPVAISKAICRGTRRQRKRRTS